MQLSMDGTFTTVSNGDSRQKRGQITLRYRIEPPLRLLQVHVARGRPHGQGHGVQPVSSQAVSRRRLKVGNTALYGHRAW